MKRFITNYKINYNEKFKYLNDLNINDNTTFKLPLIFDANYILKLYNINTIEELNTYVNNYNDNINVYELIEIINSWVYENFKTVKINKSFLSEIIFQALLILHTNDEIIKINKEEYINMINYNIDNYMNLSDITFIDFFFFSINDESINKIVK